MKVTILGSGSAYGSPMVFNTYGENQDKTDKRNERTRASIIISDLGYDILVDMSPDFRTQINQNNIKNIDAVFLTHGHNDHIASVPELWRTSALLEKTINVYASPSTMDELKTSYHYMFKESTERGSSGIMWHTIEQTNVSMGPLNLSFFSQPHGKITSTGLRYKNFAYIPDFSYFNEENTELLKGLDVLLMECNNGEEVLNNGHNNLPQALKIIDLLKPKKTILTHLSVRVDHQKFSNLLPENVELAYDGMVLDI